jgi:hypothetical protein
LIKQNRAVDYSKFEYAPWMVANLKVKSLLQEKRGEQLCWDNVLYNSSSLGYVNSQHQNISIPQQEKIITYYHPLTGTSCADQRKLAHQRSWKDWTDVIFSDLSKAHPQITQFTSSVDIHIWGHGMIRPSPGFIWGEERKLCSKSVDNRIYFAHSDLGGISVFEEAFGQGIQAARSLLSNA